MYKPSSKSASINSFKDVVIPNKSLPQMLSESVEKYSGKTAMTFEDRTYTYKELSNKIQSLTVSLKEKGVKKGDRVALMLPNCPQYPISYYAILCAGATVVQINSMYQSDELLHILEDSGAKAIIILEDLLPVVEKIKNEISLQSIIDVSLKSDSTFNQLLLNKELPPTEIDIDPKDDIAVLQYTGGTTGRSKGVMLTHYNLIANVFQSYATSNITLGKERVLTIIPLFHVYGMTGCMNLTFYTGGNLILVPRFSVKETVKIVEQYKPTTFSGVPTMYVELLNYYNKQPFDLSSMKLCSSGASPLPIEVLDGFNKKTGISIVEGFGLSEASPGIMRNPVKGIQKPGTVGISLPNTKSKIVDVETSQQELQVGEVGELVTKGPQVMKGYWNQPEETKKTLRDGWLYTGDLAFMDRDGYYTIVGRSKELIIASGYNVYPIEIEDIIYQHPKISEAAVIGVKDKYRGESVKAFVVLKEDAQLTASELTEYCEGRLAPYKVPKTIEFMKTLPKSAVGKILKRKLS